MRISDWISDVCSSVLHRGLERVRTGQELMQQQAQCIHVGGHGGRFAADLFGRGIAWRQEPLAMFGRCARGGVGGGKWPGHRVARQAMFVVVRVITEFLRSEEHTSELQSLMRISYAVFCLKKKK